MGRLAIILGWLFLGCGSSVPIELAVPPTGDPELDAAVSAAHAAAVAAPDDPVAWRDLAMVLQANELDGPAESAWGRVAELDPAEPRAPYHLARLRERRGDVEGALAALGRVFALADDYAPAHVRAGRLLTDCGRLDEAARELARALELDGASPGPRMALARLELLRDRPDAAIELLEPVRERFPREPYLNGLLARAWSMRGEEARAEEFLRAEAQAGQSSVRDPWQAEVQRHEQGLLARIGRAKARLGAGDARGAWEELEPLADRSDELVVLDVQCQVLLALGRPEEVLARVARAPAEVAANPMLVADRALALRATGRIEEAAELMAAEARRNPSPFETHALLGELLFELERPADAVIAFEAARAQGDTSLSSALFLGRARAAAGDLDGGLAELEAAARAYPRAPKPWAYRCELLALAGRAADARESLEEARRRGLEPELVERVAARIDELVGPAEGGR